MRIIVCSYGLSDAHDMNVDTKGLLYLGEDNMLGLPCTIPGYFIS